MKKTILSLVAGLFMLTCFSQNKDHNVENDSISMTTAKTDSIMEEKAKKRQEMMAKIEATVTFPVLEAGTFSGVIPVEDVTEIPDPNLEYKLLFELVNFDSDTPSKLDASIVEVARIINLHVASGIPLENISPVIVVHAGSLNAFTTNEFYNGKFKMDNPNMKLIGELEKLGAKFISCAQAMFFFEVDKEALLPMFKVSLTAQTILSSYQRRVM
ncbi:hypothetical protein [Flagellimonas sp.]|jgi:intracellular sulfur oxidation DsrE/DsrF family protein|uniref:hypothetical protein n=1 Tax=Flagellimonas sp. TaxID=2058762 RepID=UPI003BAC7EA4